MSCSKQKQGAQNGAHFNGSSSHNSDEKKNTANDESTESKTSSFVHKNGVRCKSSSTQTEDQNDASHSPTGMGTSSSAHTSSTRAKNNFASQPKQHKSACAASEADRDDAPKPKQPKSNNCAGRKIDRDDSASQPKQLLSVCKVENASTIPSCSHEGKPPTSIPETESSNDEVARLHCDEGASALSDGTDSAHEMTPPFQGSSDSCARQSASTQTSEEPSVAGSLLSSRRSSESTLTAISPNNVNDEELSDLSSVELDPDDIRYWRKMEKDRSGGSSGAGTSSNCIRLRYRSPMPDRGNGGPSGAQPPVQPRIRVEVSGECSRQNLAADEHAQQQQQQQQQQQPAVPPAETPPQQSQGTILVPSYACGFNGASNYPPVLTHPPLPHGYPSQSYTVPPAGTYFQYAYSPYQQSQAVPSPTQSGQPGFETPQSHESPGSQQDQQILPYQQAASCSATASNDSELQSFYNTAPDNSELQLQGFSNTAPNNSQLQSSSNTAPNNSELQSSSNTAPNNSELQSFSNTAPNNSELQSSNNAAPSNPVQNASNYPSQFDQEESPPMTPVPYHVVPYDSHEVYYTIDMNPSHPTVSQDDNAEPEQPANIVSESDLTLMTSSLQRACEKPKRAKVRRLEVDEEAERSENIPEAHAKAEDDNDDDVFKPLGEGSGSAGGGVALTSTEGGSVGVVGGVAPSGQSSAAGGVAAAEEVGVAAAGGSCSESNICEGGPATFEPVTSVSGEPIPGGSGLSPSDNAANAPPPLPPKRRSRTRVGVSASSKDDPTHPRRKPHSKVVGGRRPRLIRLRRVYVRRPEGIAKIASDLLHAQYRNERASKGSCASDARAAEQSYNTEQEETSDDDAPYRVVPYPGVIVIYNPFAPSTPNSSTSSEEHDYEIFDPLTPPEEEAEEEAEIQDGIDSKIEEMESQDENETEKVELGEEDLESTSEEAESSSSEWRPSAYSEDSETDTEIAPSRPKRKRLMKKKVIRRRK